MLSSRSLCLTLLLLLPLVSVGDVTVTIAETSNGVELTPTGSLDLSGSEVTLTSTTPQAQNTAPSVSAIKLAGQLSQLVVFNVGNQAYNTYAITDVSGFSFDCLKNGAQLTFVNLPSSTIPTIGFNNNNELFFDGDIGETTFVGGTLKLTSGRLASTEFVPNSVCFITFGSNPVKRVEFVVEDIASESPSMSPTEAPKEGCGKFGIGFVFCIIGDGFSFLIDLVVDIFTGIF